jgi:hypothetical protein
MARVPAALLLAVALLAPAPALAEGEHGKGGGGGSDSLSLQPSTDTLAAGGTVEVKVLGLLHPGGKAAVPVRAVDVELSVKGVGSAAPASGDAGEVRWIYRAPETVAADVSVVLEARVKAFPDANGSCTLRVKAGGNAPKPVPDAQPKEKDEGKEKEAGADEDGDAVADAQAVDADPVGNLCTLERWRVRANPEDKWLEKKIPPRGESMNAHAPLQSFRVRLNRKDINFVEVHWWRTDRPKSVRAYTERNRQLEISKDQDGHMLVSFKKEMGKPRQSYTFSIVATLADGKVVRENMTVFFGSEKAEERKKDR